jgi:DNA-binding MarR family transcriptional regulator
MKRIEEEIQQPRFRNEFHKASVNLLFSASWHSNRQREVLQPFDITLQQFNVLRILRGQHPGSISTSVIKERMLDRNSDVSRIVDRLVQRDLVGKQTCPSDKRLVDVSITADGLRILELIDTHTSSHDQALGNLTEEEARMLNHLLDKMRS